MSTKKLSASDDVIGAVKSLSKKWYPKPPAKFNHNLVNNVHSRIGTLGPSSSSDVPILHTLYLTLYFENVLWKFYHEDVTNNHIELVILLCLYESSHQSSSCIIDALLQQDKDDFNKLLQRILTISLNKRASYRSRALVVLFMNQLVTAKLSHPLVKQTIRSIFDVTTWSNFPAPYTLRSGSGAISLKVGSELYQAYHQLLTDEKPSPIAKLKKKWLYSLLSDYMSTASRGEYKQLSKTELDSFLNYSKALVTFCNSLVSQLPLRITMFTLISNLRFISCFTNDLAQILKPYIELLKSTLHFPIDEFSGGEITEAKSSNFDLLQSALFASVDTTSDSFLSSYLSKPTIHDYTSEELFDFFNGFEMLTLKAISHELQLIDNIPTDLVSSKSFLVSVLFEYAQSRPPTFEKYSNSIYEWDEKSTIDEFIRETAPPFPFPSALPPLNKCQFLSTTDYLQRNLINLYEQFRSGFHHHVTNVLSRVSLTGKNASGAPKLKGSSKYLAQVKITPTPVSLQLKFDSSSAKAGNSMVAVIELQKPNSLSPHLRLSQHGLSLLRLVKLGSRSSKDHTYDIERCNQGADSTWFQRVNFAIKLSPALSEQLHDLTYINQILKSRKANDRLPSFFNDLFLGFGSAKQARPDRQPNQPRNIMWDGLNESELVVSDDQEEKDRQSKRQKGNDGDVVNREEAETGDLSGPGFKLNEEQSRVVRSGVSTGLTVVSASHHTGVKTVIATMVNTLLLNYPHERHLILVPDTYDGKLSDDWRWYHYTQEPSKVINKIAQVLKEVDQTLSGPIASIMSETGLGDLNEGDRVENALAVYQHHIIPRWQRLFKRMSETSSAESMKKLVSELKLTSSLGDVEWCNDWRSNLKRATVQYHSVKMIFFKIQRLGPVVKIHDTANPKQSTAKLGHELNELFSRQICHAVVMKTSDYKTWSHENTGLPYKFDSIILVDHKSVQGVSQIVPMLQSASELKRISVIAHNSCPGSMYTRLVHEVRCKPQTLQQHVYNARPEICGSGDVDGDQLMAYNPGFEHVMQIVEVESTNAAAKVSVPEAQMAVAIYQYMRLLAYPRDKISVVVRDAYQKSLVEEVLMERKVPRDQAANDSSSAFQFGWPRIESVDTANANDYVIASLWGSTRTQDDVRQLRRTSRLGLYVVGSSSGGTASHEGESTVYEGPLGVYTGGNYIKRADDRDRGAKKEVLYQLRTVEQMRQYVYNMTKTRLGV